MPQTRSSGLPETSALTRARNSKVFWPAVIGTVFLAGVAVRVFGAWIFHYAPDSDSGIVTLMAKHMAEGRDFPVFFYGQPYRGSLEPAFSALLCRLFGVSSFVVHLGTALLGSLVPILAYLWASDAGGRRAGLLAALYCLVGSLTLFGYSVVPRGGYMTMMVCGMTVLLLSIRIARRARKNEPLFLWHYGVLGLIAGLGWWSDQMIAPFFMAAGLILLPTMDRAFFRSRLPAAFLGFLAGSLPWWAWNLTHHWQSIRLFSVSTQNWPLSSGLGCAWQAFTGLVQLPSDTLWGEARAILLLAMLAVSIVLLVRERWRGENKDRFSSRLAAVLVGIFAVWLYARCDYGNPPESRYMMPLYPAVAVLVGVGADWLLNRFRFPFGAIAVLALIPACGWHLADVTKNIASWRNRWECVERDAPRLASLCDGVCIAEWSWNWMTFASREKLCVVRLPKERYAPNARRGELAERPAVLADYRRVNTFLANTHATASQTTFAGIPVTYGMTPPPQTWRYVDAADWSEARDDDGADWRKALSDGNMDTIWSGDAQVMKPGILVCTFTRPVRLCGIRLFSADDVGPHWIQVEGQTTTNGEWSTLIPNTAPTCWFWSGPHPKLEGLQKLSELRFRPLMSGVVKVRLTIRAVHTAYQIHLGEILFMEEATRPEGEYPSAEACANQALRAGVEQFYGPRWMAERVALRAGDRMSVLAPSAVTSSINELPDYDSMIPPSVILRGKTGFLMDVRDVPRSQTILHDLNLQWQEIPMGLYSLLVVAKPDDGNESGSFPALYWTEAGCFEKDLRPFRKGRAQWHFQRAMDSRLSHSAADRITELRAALRTYPGHQPARTALISALESAGRHEESLVEKATLKEQTAPGVPAHVRFANGVELIGITVKPNALSAGQPMDVTYFWKYPTTVDPDRFDVFVHFEEAKQRFQDDHGLLHQTDPDLLREQPFDEVFTEFRRTVVPGTIPPGEYHIRIGLCENGRRLRLKTELPQDDRAVELPVAVTVTAKP